MTPKSELRQQIADLQQEIANRDARITSLQHKLAKYFPFADDLEALFDTLTKMGLESRIREILMVGQIYVFDELTNPLNGERYASHYVKVSVDKSNATGHYEVFVEGMTLPEYFSQELMVKEDLDRLAEANPRVKEIWEENQKMKKVLELKGQK